MARPKGGYFKINPDTGKKYRVPGVTTVLNQIGWGKDGLVYWANQQGLDGLTLDEARQPAMDVGTVAHAAIEAEVTSQPPPDLSGLDVDTRTLVDRSIEAWHKWVGLHNFVPIAAEWSECSKAYDYGGTLDMAFVLGEMSLVDFKTSKALYAKDLCQLIAYGKLWAEYHPDQPILRYHLLRLSKDDGSFHHHSWHAESLEPAWRVFLYCLELKKLEKLLGSKL